MSARIQNITVDCDDALLVARFWSSVLGRPLDPGGDTGFASIGVADEARSEPAWLFEHVPEPKERKNRMHLDLIDADPEAVQRFVVLGATVIAKHELSGHEWTVLQDPQGNEFCVAVDTYTG